MSPMTNPRYTGHFRHSLDDKNRLTIPSGWRVAHTEDDEFVALPHPDGYIAVLPPPEVDRLYEKAATKNLSDSEAQDVLTQLFAHAQTLRFDKQGRIGIAPELLRHAGISKEAVLAGSLSKFAIWSPEQWDVKGQRMDSQTYRDLMRRAGI
ncbi:MAG TPA: division/cell wall cluster transcriptional repressor MraZ [Opitutaceae bacterium]|nr:division/cell wall cluster transcriptional repressor MraZ [Opitutaceae bacterium]